MKLARHGQVRRRDAARRTAWAAVAALLVMALVPAIGHAESIKRVLIANPQSDPVNTRPVGVTEVSGAVQVGGAVQLAGVAQVGGTVGIDPTANGVAITNSEPIPVLPVGQADAGVPVVVTRTFVLPAQSFAEVFGLYDVPPGKRLIVEHISAEVILGPDEVPSVSIGASGTARHFLMLQRNVASGSIGSQRATGSQSVLLVADDAGSGGDDLKVFMQRSPATSTTGISQTFAFSGRLYDL